MGYGLRVVGSSGAVQIDQDYSNKVVVQRGVVDRLGQLILEQQYFPEYVTNLYARPIPLNSFNSGDRVWTALTEFYHGKYLTGDDWDAQSGYDPQELTCTFYEGRFSGEYTFVGASTANDGMYEYIAVGDLSEYQAYLESKGQTMKTGGYGLEVLKADGKLAFHPSAEFLKLSHKLEVPAASVNQTFTFSLPAANHKYWFDVSQLDSYFKFAMSDETTILINTGRSYTGGSLVGSTTGATLKKTILIADMP